MHVALLPRFLSSFSFAFVFAFLCWECSAVAVAQDTVKMMVDPSGTWRWEYDLDGQQFKDQVRLTLGEAIKDSKDKTLKGKYQSSSGRKIDIENGRVSGDKVSFEFKINYQGMDVKLLFDGTVKKDSLDGTVKASTDAGSRDLDWTATRSVLADDVVGKWKLRIDANGNVMEPILTITKDGEQLKASYALGNDVKIEAKDVKIEKNELTFTVEADFQGSRIKADFMGSPLGDKIKGSIDYALGNDAGEVEFTGERRDDAI
jgi:autotransporter translocation and assembly factor TamB